MQPSNLVALHSQTLKAAGEKGAILDLACGNGRNGIYLVQQGQRVVFSDREKNKLDGISRLLDPSELTSYWCVDFEEPRTEPLSLGSFSAIVVFRYLHRPLMQAIKHGVQRGGLIIYETFTIDQTRFGRPGNADFLLQPGELEDVFRGWEILHSFEGVSVSELNGQQQAIAQLVARKPD
ncbi:hypothetical protein [Candidatus Marimicrobium litorale]|uniref:SAM-dependent methyltransferase n=1 Tax=Candidatus Marimicrobium litorale TaxID=2518991 RepID=A0ABT3T8P7_9GAMM|nr:hypothetical protein [Candidatus Marimicrobium litorale]MCX2978637.1 SAM-dependent methyltransferase [Candidatus Marimicrobium litorale]